MATYALRGVYSGGLLLPIADTDKGRVNILSIGTSALNSDLTKAILDNLAALQSGTDFSDGTNSHTHDGRYFTETELADITDGSAGADAIGATAVGSGASTTVQGILEELETSIATLEGAQLEWQDSVLDRLATPPVSPTLGDRYLVIATATDAWVGQEDKIAEYNGATWDFTAPTTGTYLGVDDETDGIYYYGGSSWVKQLWEATTGSGFIDVTNRDVTLKNLTNDALIVGDGSGVAVEVNTSSVGDILADHTAGLTIKAGVVTNTEVDAAAGIVESKLSLDYSTSGLNTSIGNHIADTANPHSVTKSQVLTGDLIVNSDVDAAAAIALSKLASGTDAQIIVGNGSGVPTYVTMSGDITISNAGVMSIGADKIKDTMVDWGSGAGQIDAADVPVATSATNYTETSSDIAGHLTGIDNKFATVTSNKLNLIAGEAFAANTSFLVRYALNGETAGRAYKAEKASAVTNGEFWAVGAAHSTSAVSAGGSIEVTREGDIHTLGSSDTAFGATEIGLPVYLSAAGAFDIYSQVSYSAGDAIYKVGQVAETGKVHVTGLSMMTTAE